MPAPSSLRRVAPDAAGDGGEAEHLTGCRGAWPSLPALEAGDRWFESTHPDQHAAVIPGPAEGRSPESIFCGELDSGLAASPRPGMTRRERQLFKQDTPVRCGDRNGYGRACKARTCGFESRPQLQFSPRICEGDTCRSARTRIHPRSSMARAPNSNLGSVQVRVLPRVPIVHVAQWIRAEVSDASGCAFESRRGPQRLLRRCACDALT